MEAARLRLEPAVPQVSEAHTGWALIAGRDAVFCLWWHLDYATHRARAQGNAGKRSEDEMLPLDGMHQRMLRRYFVLVVPIAGRHNRKMCCEELRHAQHTRARWTPQRRCSDRTVDRRGMCYGAIGLQYEDCTATR